MRRFTLFIIILCSCSASLAHLTKESITKEVNNMNTAIRSEMARMNSKNCIIIGNEIISDFNKAHDFFLNEHYQMAVIEALKSVEESARKAYGYKECRMSVVARSNNAALYLRYFFQIHNKQQSPVTTLNTKGTDPTDGERSVLLSTAQYIAADLTKYCSTSSCTPSEKRIITFAKALSEELKKKDFSTYLVAEWLLAIKSNIAIDFISSNQPNTLKKYHTQIHSLLPMIQRYLFTESDLILPRKTQSLLFNLELKEKNPASLCSVLLYQYYSTLGRDHNTTPQGLLVTYIFEHNKLFELLNDALYFQKFHSKECAIDKVNLFDVAFAHANKVMTEISSAMSNISLE